jgi:hypothetical protein
MRRRPVRLLSALPLGLALACAASPGPEPELAEGPAATPAPTVAPSAEPAPAGEKGEPTEPVKPKEPEPDPACSAGMVLVEGDYCTKVQHDCDKSWYADWNKKKVCERFSPPAKCLGQKVKKRFCIDKYSWPNKKGERPEVMNNFYQAQVKCAAVGKRMCNESEWNFACEGPEMKPFPYGWTRDPTKCNGDHKWDHPDMKKVARRDPAELARLWKGVRSGSQAECVSDFGVHDLPANNDEVVASEGKGKFDSVHTGGPWYEGVRNQCRPKIYTHDEGFYYYFLGFRCCAEPDDKPTDPRTPKQRDKKWAFSRVERLAGFSVEDMKKKLALKAENKCECSARDIQCKTMCGTLLGPSAKDTDLEKRKTELQKERERKLK